MGAAKLFFCLRVGIQFAPFHPLNVTSLWGAAEKDNKLTPNGVQSDLLMMMTQTINLLTEDGIPTCELD